MINVDGFGLQSVIGLIGGCCHATCVGLGRIHGGAINKTHHSRLASMMFAVGVSTVMQLRG